MSFFHKLPKAELHVHLEGTLEPEHLFKLAERNHINLLYKTVEECIASYQFNDLPSFLRVYYNGMKVLQTEENFYELAYQYFERAAKDSIVYVEPFFDPQAHTSRGIKFSTIINGIHRAQLDAKNKLNINSNLIMCFLRDQSAESALAHLNMALPFKDWIIGVGLDSDEYNNPPIKFKEVFSQAREHGFKLTMHCDPYQTNSIQHIQQCLDIIKVDRIDHGINSLENEEVCNNIVKRKIGLTICPKSNTYLVNNATAHEVRQMLNKGMLATINSDDPAYFRAYLNDNFELLAHEGLNKTEIVQLIKNSFDVAWINNAERAQYYELLQNAINETY